MALSPRWSTLLLNAVVCAINGARTRRREVIRAERQASIAAALAGGPDALSARQKLDLLDDPTSMTELHSLVWSANDLHPAWSAATGGSTCNDATS